MYKKRLWEDSPESCELLTEEDGLAGEQDYPSYLSTLQRALLVGANLGEVDRIKYATFS